MLFKVQRLFAITFLSLLLFSAGAQPSGIPAEIPGKKESKPYKVLTDGKQITIKSNREIKHVMLWTSRGNRIVEQKEINANSFTFRVPINDKYFFLMVGVAGGKVYSEKIGVN